MSRSDDPCVIEAHALTRIYPLENGGAVGIRDIDLYIRNGEMAVIKGNSGSGKSTLLALIGGLDRPSRGRIVVGGRDLTTASAAELTAYRRTTVGMVFQAFNLLPTLTALENVCLPALLAGMAYETTRESALNHLRELGIEKLADRYPAQLSGGEMQRSAIARALINNPSIVLADEPTGNLDSRNGEIVMRLLADLNQRQGRTVIVATHSALADPYATVQITLRDGMIAQRTPCNG
ncbi:MAG: transporter ATP-binding protein [Thermodesulfobacteriota bacterium]|nr:transporter ATP-binding protein [Thermodesulfobacteriota bacterium]